MHSYFTRYTKYWVCMICHLPFNVSHLPFVCVRCTVYCVHSDAIDLSVFIATQFCPKQIQLISVLLFEINFKSLYELVSLFLVSVILLFIFTKNDFILTCHSLPVKNRWLVWISFSVYVQCSMLNWIQNDWRFKLRFLKWNSALNVQNFSMESYFFLLAVMLYVNNHFHLTFFSTFFSFFGQLSHEYWKIVYEDTMICVLGSVFFYFLRCLLVRFISVSCIEGEYPFELKEDCEI